MPASKWLPAAAMLLALPAAAAAQVYKCVDGNGASYQSEPCAAGQVTARAWRPIEYAPPSAAERERVDGIRQAAVRRDAGLRTSARRGGTARAGTGARAGSSIGACEAARQKRDRELAAMGKAGRKIETRRAADARVAAVCR